MVSDSAASGAIGQRRKACLLAIAALVVTGWLIMAVFSSGQARLFWTALALGTTFAQVTLAATYSALGPLALFRRLPLAAAWLAAIMIAIGLRAPRMAVLVVVSIALLCQWLLVQAPLWLLVARYGLRICPLERIGQAAAPVEQQFGIRQLMTLTAIVAVVLAVGRLAFARVEWGDGNDFSRGFVIFSFLTLANALVATPLIAAALLPRGAALASAAAIALVALATVVEAPLFRSVAPRGAPPVSELYAVFAWMNGWQCAWILGVLFLLRAGGYRLTSAHKQQGTEAAPLVKQTRTFP